MLQKCNIFFVICFYLFIKKQIMTKLVWTKNSKIEYNWIKSGFENWDFWWLASSVDIYWADPELIRDADYIKKYVKELCELIEMKRFWETEVVHFWEDEKVAWFSMIQLIETSLISWHFANNTNVAYLDIFSCKYYDPLLMAKFSLEFFKWEYFKINIGYRDVK